MGDVARLRRQQTARPPLRRPPHRPRPRAPASATGRAGAGTCREGSVLGLRDAQPAGRPRRVARRSLRRAAAARLRPGDGVHLVGGAVRDLLLERVPRELDLVVEGDVDAAAARLDGAVTAHDRFGTARVHADGCAFDLVRARAESYAHPGALPDVRPGSLDEDLHRRDVTVNAMAFGPRRRAACGARRARGSARRRAARPARRLVRRRPHARVARRALRGASGLHRRAAHARAGCAGRPRDGQRRPARRRAAPGAARTRPAGGVHRVARAQRPLPTGGLRAAPARGCPPRWRCCRPTAGWTC